MLWAAAVVWAASAVGLTMEERCEDLEDSRPAELWCVDSEKGWPVGAERECANTSVLFCRTRGCQQSSDCVSSVMELLIDTEDLRNEDTRRLCSCLGASYAVTTDTQGFLQCVTVSDMSSPFSHSFDIDTNTLRYTHATCDQLARCQAIQAYDDAKLWLSIKNITSCTSYHTCVQNKQIAGMTECLYKDLFTIIDGTDQPCTPPEKRAICEPEAKAALCNNCADVGAIADQPGEDPPASVCAYTHQCAVKDPSEPNAKQFCEQVINDERGEWCPTLAEAVNAYPPVVLPPQLYTNPELCTQCETANPSALCCAYNNTFKTVGTEPECTAQGEAFCPSVSCPASTACQYAFSRTSLAYMEKSYTIVKELCDCLGEDFRMIRLQNGFFSCISTLLGTHWNTNTWDIGSSQRKYESVTCKQLARCEPKNALDNVLYLQALPDECEDTKLCDMGKERGEAIACSMETIYDKDSNQCSVEEAAKHCNAELTAINCLTCPNGMGLNSTLRVCATDSGCTEVTSRDDCNGYYCPDILDRIPLSYHEMCRACEVLNPGELCCANEDANEAKVVASGGECAADKDMLCAHVPCEPSSECAASSSEDAILLELCNCLGSEFTIDVHPLTESPYCAYGPTKEAWDGWITVDTDTAMLKNLQCLQLDECLPDYLRDVVQHYNNVPASCAHEKQCFTDRSAQREMLCQPVGVYRDVQGAKCSEDESLQFCRGVAGVSACMQCEGGISAADAVCVEGGCVPNTTRDECGGMWCPSFLETADPPFELGPPAKGTVVHEPMPPPPPPPSTTGWWVALGISFVACMGGIFGVHILQNAPVPEGPGTPLDYSPWHDYST